LIVLASERTLASKPSSPRPSVDARVVFLTHYIPLYQVRVLQSIAARVRDFHVLVSTPIEPNRNFAPDWSGLDVTVQNTCTLRRCWRFRSEEAQFEDQLYVHFPYDTARRLRELKPDIVMSLELGARSLGAVRYCLRHQAKSVLCTYMSEHTEKGRGWARNHLRRWLLRRADGLTYNGQSCKRYLQSFGVPDQRLHHLPYAADDRTIYSGPVRRNDQKTRRKLLCVGQLTERKGVIPMLRQLSAYCLKHPNRYLEISFAGTGPLQSAIESFDAPENLTIRMLGNVKAADLGNTMLEHGALIAPTLADEWMLVINEALQAGLPVIGSIYAQATGELVHDHVNGWRYDPTAPATLTRALNAYLGASCETIAQMRIDAQESVAERTPQWAANGALNAMRYVLGNAHEPTTLRAGTGVLC
jgi:glycosyltransferase involved in cell wall biosynthesis